MKDDLHKSIFEVIPLEKINQAFVNEK